MWRPIPQVCLRSVGRLREGSTNMRARLPDSPDHIKKTHKKTRKKTERTDRAGRSRRRRLGVPLLGVVGVIAALVLGVPTGQTAAHATKRTKDCTVSAKLVPSCGKWWGVSPGTYQDRVAGTRAFEQQLGAPVDVYKAYHFAGQLFPNDTELALANEKGHHRLLDIDYVPDGTYNWAQVAAGDADAMLITEARYLKTHFSRKLFISIHHEPEDEVVETKGSGHRAEDFAAMFRHVVDVFRTQGVTNVVWVYNIMGSQDPDSASWFPALYPGDRYVDWIAGDPYGCFNAKVCNDFDTSTINQRFSANAPWLGFYRWATTTHPGKPLMLSEWAAYTNVSGTDRVRYLRTVHKELGKFPMLKAVLYWNSKDAQRGNCALAPGSHASNVVSRLARGKFFKQPVP